jgi:capsular polysaccharide transport system permease protein
MTTKLTVKRFRTRRPDPVAAPPVAPAAVARPQAVPLTLTAPTPRAVTPVAAARPAPTPVPQAPAAGAKRIGDDAFFPAADADGFGNTTFPTARAADSAPPHYDNAPHDIDAIRREGLTGRQLRMARRLAQKHHLPATSDFDAVRLLRQQGIDPFQANSVLELVQGGGDKPPSGGSRALTVTPGDGIQLPQTIKPMQLPTPDQRAEMAHIAEVGRIQRDIVARRRKKSILLAARLFVFVGLPTLLAAIYYYTIATPFYSTHAEFVIQQAEPGAAGASGMGSLLRGTAMASSQDSIAVQGYLQSPDAMNLLDQDQGFRAHFSNPEIDPIQRLPEGASNTAAYKMFKRNVKISYDPTEGIIKMEVIAADPQKSVEFSKALIGYAEQQVDHLTQRLRADQMEGAQQSYDSAEKNLAAANARVVELQEKYKTLSSEVEIGLITGQIGTLETQLSQDRLSLAQMESNENPNAARMEPVKRRIATLEQEIAELRSKMTEDSESGLSIARVQSELLVAQADVQTRQLLLAQSLQAMESARVAANRQTRYLSISVNPVAPDEAAYPRAFENTLVVMLIFAGIYLMITMTLAILREQITA